MLFIFSIITFFEEEGFIKMSIISIEKDEDLLEEFLDRCNVSGKTQAGLEKAGITRLSLLAHADVHALNMAGISKLTAIPLVALAQQELVKK